MQEATCIIPHQKFVELINILFKWFIFLHEQLGKYVISGGRLGDYVGGTMVSFC